jgi:hypothetical protein
MLLCQMLNLVLMVRLMMPATVATVLAPERPATGVEMMMQTAPENVHAVWGAAALAPASEPAAAATSLAATVAAVAAAAAAVTLAAPESDVELAPLVASAALAASAAGAVAAPCAAVVVG